MRLLRTEDPEAARLGLGTHREVSQVQPALPQKSVLPHPRRMLHIKGKPLRNLQIFTEVPVKPRSLATSSDRLCAEAGAAT